MYRESANAAMDEARMAEKESKFVASMAAAVHVLIDVAEGQQAAVAGLLKETRDAAKSTAEAAQLSKKSNEELPALVSASVERAFEGAATQAATLLTKKFVLADQQACLAAERYERAARLLGWRMVVAACTLGAVMLAVVTTLILRSIPYQEEIRVLQDTVDRLERRGGRAQTMSCPGDRNTKRLCVRVFDLQTKQEEWRVIAGYQ